MTGRGRIKADITRAEHWGQFSGHLLCARHLGVSEMHGLGEFSEQLHGMTRVALLFIEQDTKGQMRR